MPHTAQARVELGAVIVTALRAGEAFMREAESQHQVAADRRASLTEVLLAHRVVAVLRSLADMLPAAAQGARPCV